MYYRLVTRVATHEYVSLFDKSAIKRRAQEHPLHRAGEASNPENMKGDPRRQFLNNPNKEPNAKKGEEGYGKGSEEVALIGPAQSGPPGARQWSNKTRRSNRRSWLRGWNCRQSIDCVSSQSEHFESLPPPPVWSL